MKKEKLKVLMLGADRSVKGGVSGVVNNLYAAGIEDYIELTYIGTMVDGSKLTKLFKAVEAYIRFIFSIKKYDIVHVNMASDASYYRKLFFIKGAKKHGKKLVIHQHGGDVLNFYGGMQGEKREKMISSLNLCDAFVVLDDEWARFWADIISPPKIHVVGNGVFIPKKEIRQENYSNLNMCYLGRICKDKGIRELVEAVTALKEKYSNLHLYIGGTMEETDLESVFSGKEDFISRLGWISAGEREELFDKCSIFVLPSYFEGMPLSAIEAMAYGKAIVATNVGGLGRMFENGKDAVLVKEKSTQDLLQGLDKVLGDVNLRKQLGMNARDKAESRYDIGNSVRKLVNIYEKI